LTLSGNYFFERPQQYYLIVFCFFEITLIKFTVMSDVHKNSHNNNDFFNNEVTLAPDT